MGRGSVDAYMQKAVFSLAQEHRWHLDTFIEWLKQGAFLMLNDYDDSGRYWHSGPYLHGRFVQRTSERMEKLMHDILRLLLRDSKGYGVEFSLWQGITGIIHGAAASGDPPRDQEKLGGSL